VSRLEPILEEDKDPIFGFYVGMMEIAGDTESPIPTDAWKHCK
jgi:hypothetical protein